MGVVVKSKWRKRGPRTLEDRAGVIGFNIWKIAQETFRHMEKEGFRFGSDRQVIDVISEMLAFLVQIVDRTVYGQVSEEDRATLINAVGRHLAQTMENNLLDLFGPGDYRAAFIRTLNERFGDYAECAWTAQGPSYEFLRLLGEKVSDAMAVTDNRWVIEHVMEIESPDMIKPLRKVIGEVLGVKLA